MAANNEAVCDVCSNAIASPGGYLLVTRQVVGSPRYWQTYLHTFEAFLKNTQLRENCGKTVAGQKTPWLVCEACIPKFAVDRDAARRYAEEWWQSGGKYRPPGSGPAPLSAVRMAEQPPGKPRKGALDWLVRPWRAGQLWRQLGKDPTHNDGQAGVDRCTELIGLMDDRSTSPSLGNAYANRANYHLALDEYEQAVEDFASAADYYRRKDERANVHFMEGKMRLAHALQLEGQTPRESRRAARLREIRERNPGIFGSPKQEDFYGLLECLDDPDPEVCGYANEKLAALPFSLKTEYVKWVASYYLNFRSSRPKSASLAGRMLGRLLFPAPQDIYPAEIGKVKYGIPVAFVNSTCAHCGYLNLGIPVPPEAVYNPLYSQKEPTDACHVPVICDRCNQLFYLAW
jgi:hypothetical protein